MKTNKAFTLIELLVVVLIIGILAAIAVPQYQFAVLKTKYNNLKPITTSIFRAAHAYNLANNKWPSSTSQLDISVPADIDCQLNSSSGAALCYLYNYSMAYVIYYNNNVSNNAYCVAYENSADNGHKLCQQETNTTNKIDNGWYIYPYKI